MFLLLAVVGLVVAGSFVLDSLEDELTDSLSAGSEDNLVEQVGTEGDDLLMGTEAADLLEGLEGDDRLEGGDGADLVRGGEGADLLFGGPGEDSLFGGVGDDNIFGEEGEDRIDGQDGSDVVFASSGDDTVFGGRGRDVIFGGTGEDELTGNAGRDLVFGVNAFLDDAPLEELAASRKPELTAPILAGPINLEELIEQGLRLEDDDSEDTLFGNNDRDTLVMGSGDIATGGFGFDNFIATALEGFDGMSTITDFNPDQDRLSLVVDADDAGVVNFREDGVDLIVSYGGLDVVRLAGLAGVSLDPERIEVLSATA